MDNNEINKNNNYINNNDIEILGDTQKQALFVDQENKKTNSAKWKIATIGGLVAVIIKFKAVLLLLLGKLKFIFIFLKLGKILGTLGSMLLMIWVEALRYGWMYGVGFVLLIFAHEMGHYLMAKHEKLNVGTPIFIPFFGAFISLKENPKSALTEAKVALAGPIVGSIAALLLVPVYILTELPVFLSLAYVGVVINIFNLIPISPLDGGRVAAAASPKLWIAGLVLVLIFFFKTFSPILIMIVILGCIRIYEFWKNGLDVYYELPLSQRIKISIIYFALIGFLGITAFVMYKIL